MDFTKLKQFLDNRHQPGYRFDQFQHLIDQGDISYDACLSWPQSLRSQAESVCPLISWENPLVKISSDGTVKAVLTLKDKLCIETVLMSPMTGHLSVCVSCEVGCPMNCVFCATGKQGFKRILTAEEITDQLLFWRHYLKSQNQPHQINSLVFMGMGEPFHNREAVFEAIDWLNYYYKLGMRHISVSTSGIPEGILALGESYPQVNLAISLHAATDTKRSQLMPVNQAHPLDILKASLKNYLAQTNRQLMFEYLLMANVNDQQTDSQALIAFLSDFPKHLIHVNLIRYNPTDPTITAPNKDVINTWLKTLEAAGISVSIRKNLGTDIQGACGQLAQISSVNQS
jgi:adenine C2-methylase RlmN of 23S rRNA A2503 and tRNA A37